MIPWAVHDDTNEVLWHGTRRRNHRQGRLQTASYAAVLYGDRKGIADIHSQSHETVEVH